MPNSFDTSFIANPFSRVSSVQFDDGNIYIFIVDRIFIGGAGFAVIEFDSLISFDDFHINF
jgi:hypothetical protein